MARRQRHRVGQHRVGQHRVGQHRVGQHRVDSTGSDDAAWLVVVVPDAALDASLELQFEGRRDVWSLVSRTRTRESHPAWYRAPVELRPGTVVESAVVPDGADGPATLLARLAAAEVVAWTEELGWAAQDEAWLLVDLGEETVRAPGGFEATATWTLEGAGGEAAPTDDERGSGERLTWSVTADAATAEIVATLVATPSDGGAGDDGPTRCGSSSGWASTRSPHPTSPTPRTPTPVTGAEDEIAAEAEPTPPADDGGFPVSERARLARDGTHTDPMPATDGDHRPDAAHGAGQRRGVPGQRRRAGRPHRDRGHRCPPCSACWCSSAASWPRARWPATRR